MVIVIASAFVFRNIDKALYAGIVVIITSVVLDVVLYGRDEAKLIYIISDHAEKIAGRLLEELDIGVTYVQGSGCLQRQGEERHHVCHEENISPKAEEIVKGRGSPGIYDASPVPRRSSGRAIRAILVRNCKGQLLNFRKNFERAYIFKRIFYNSVVSERTDAILGIR